MSTDEDGSINHGRVADRRCNRAVERRAYLENFATRWRNSAHVGNRAVLPMACMKLPILAHSERIGSDSGGFGLT
jgi:hypothetical protein